MNITLNQDALLEINNLKMHFPVQKGFLNKNVGYVKAVDDVSFTLRQGEVLGLVGESGCGKTTLGRSLLRIYNPTSGEILYKVTTDKTVDLCKADKKELKRIRQDIRMIFQDPQSSLNPRLTILQIIGEPLIINGIAKGKQLEERVIELLEMVGLRPEYIRRYPHAFSGGERQRIGIARSLALNPKIIVADEAVSALDVSVQAQVLNLLSNLKKKFNLTYLFVAHDLSVVKHICDRVAVMYVGKLVEVAPADKLFREPGHPYTAALLSAVPNTNPRLRENKDRIKLEGEVADPADPPSGCYFHPRCIYAEEICKRERPALREVENGHQIACHLTDKINLKERVKLVQS